VLNGQKLWQHSNIWKILKNSVSVVYFIDINPREKKGHKLSMDATERRVSTPSILKF